MNTQHLTQSTFEASIAKPGIVFIDWWAAWCAPCRAFAPVFDAASMRHPHVTWAKVDVDQERELSATFRVRSVPTLMVFRDGVLVFSQPGLLPGAALDKLVAEVERMDVRSVAKQQGRSPDL